MTKLMNAKKTYNIEASDNDDISDEDFVERTGTLGYFHRVKSSSVLDIYMDGPFREPSYYRQICQAIQDTGEDDVIRFHINSTGGRVDSLCAIISAIWKTNAKTEAHLEGSAYSAASILAMHCESVMVSPLADMMIHNVSFGTMGKSSDIRGYVDHVSKTSEKLFRESYELFLTEEEIDRCLNGYEHWLDAEEIMQRLAKKYEILNQRILEQEQQEEVEVQQEVQEVKPKRKQKAKVQTEQEQQPE